MQPEIKRDAAYAVGALVAITSALIIGINAVPKPPAPPPVITLHWAAPRSHLPVVTEVWGTTNLSTWYHKLDVPSTNRVTLAATNRCEFFKLRHKVNLGGKWYFTDWALKN